MSHDSKTIKLTGKVSLEDIQRKIEGIFYDVIDASEAEFGEEIEEWYQFLGYSHCGPVYGAARLRKVDVLSRFIQNAWTERLILPGEVMRRHLNRIISSPRIRFAQIHPDSKLFSMDGDIIKNKKGTKILYDPTLLPSIVPIDFIAAISSDMYVVVYIGSIPISKVKELGSEKAFMDFLLDFGHNEYLKDNKSSTLTFFSSRPRAIDDLDYSITLEHWWVCEETLSCDTPLKLYSVETSLEHFMNVMHQKDLTEATIVDPFAE